ncbi:MAG: hypothetical protein N3F62_04600 [Bacteroidia bacterium]|jgi:hypothetical protein|nr:hypothetical protein [Bacteroidia bacterium]
MRVIDTIPHPSMSIQIFIWNNKYIVKFEAGPMEQHFKFPLEDIPSIEHLKSVINADFIEKVRKRFNDMYQQLIDINFGKIAE